MCIVNRQSQVELTLAASIGLDRDGGSGNLGEDTGFSTSLWTGELQQGWMEGLRLQTNSLLELSIFTSLLCGGEVMLAPKRWAASMCLCASMALSSKRTKCKAGGDVAGPVCTVVGRSFSPSWGVEV